MTSLLCARPSGAPQMDGLQAAWTNEVRAPWIASLQNPSNQSKEVALHLLALEKYLTSPGPPYVLTRASFNPLVSKAMCHNPFPTQGAVMVVLKTGLLRQLEYLTAMANVRPPAGCASLAKVMFLACRARTGPHFNVLTIRHMPCVLRAPCSHEATPPGWRSWRPCASALSRSTPRRASVRRASRTASEWRAPSAEPSTFLCTGMREACTLPVHAGVPGACSQPAGARGVLLQVPGRRRRRQGRGRRQGRVAAPALHMGAPHALPPAAAPHAATPLRGRPGACREA
jgi:hypothetical protein